MAVRTSFDPAKMEVCIPLDLSFNRYKDLSEIEVRAPKKNRSGKAPRRGESKKFVTRAVWLNTNLLTSIVGFEKFINKILDVPQNLSWLDIALNKITRLDESLAIFPNMVILYVHGNEIDDFRGIAVLRKLKKLKRLTLHGNPIEKESGYRQIIINLLPQIANLDFVAISLQEKKVPPPPGSYKKYGSLLNSPS